MEGESESSQGLLCCPKALANFTPTLASVCTGGLCFLESLKWQTQHLQYWMLSSMILKLDVSEYLNQRQSNTINAMNFCDLYFREKNMYYNFGQFWIRQDSSELEVLLLTYFLMYIPQRLLTWSAPVSGSHAKLWVYILLIFKSIHAHVSWTQ